MGALVGNLVVYLRAHHKEAVGLDEFLSLGLVAVGFALAAALLNAATGFCLGCEVYLLLTRVRARSGRTPSPVTSPVTSPVSSTVTTN